MIVIKVCCQCKENKLKGLNFIFSLLFHRKFDKIAPICALEILCSPSPPIKINTNKPEEWYKGKWQYITSSDERPMI